MIRNIIFDLDGTLVDSLPGIQWSVEAALAACGVCAGVSDLKPLIGPPIREILAAVASTNDAALMDRMEQAFRSSYDSAGWRETRWQEGALATLERLAGAGRRLWLVTNKPDRATGMILRHLAAKGYFKEVVCRDSRTPPFGSKAEMLADLLSRRELDRAETMMVGDTLEDCEAAASAGIPCALTPHGYGAHNGAALPAGSRSISGWGELLASAGQGSEGDR
jgi:phosphoglycolate phosphatase